MLRECRIQVATLIKHYGLQAFLSPRGKEWTASVQNRVIVGPRLTSEPAYAIWLHELGHIALNSRDEYIAWQWAEDNALFWSEQMQRMRELGLSTYFGPNSHRHEKWPARRFNTARDVAAFCQPFILED